MPPFIKKIQDATKGMSPRDFVYPGILLLFVIIVSIIFFIATRTITKNVNDAFSSDAGGESSALNMTNYALVAKKLGFSTETGAIVVSSTSPASPATTTQTLDKKTLAISILNSTAKKGVATTLAQALESAGFAKATTGNEKKLYATTTVVIVETKKEYETILLEAVQKTYPDAIATTTPTSAIDATIIIGTK